MDSYIEISFLHNLLLIYVSCMVGKYVSVQPISTKKIWIYTVSMAGSGCFLWFPNAWILICFLEATFFFFYFRYIYRAYLVGLCFRFLCSFTCFVIYQGGFHNLLWFVPVDAFIYPTWMFYILLYSLLANKWKDILSRRSYIYKVYLHVEGHCFSVLGYLDSGNLLTYQGIPVIFMDKKFQAYFKNQRIELVVRNTISGTDVIRCYECEISIQGGQRHKVLLSCENTITLPMKCEVLLHTKVITQG